MRRLALALAVLVLASACSGPRQSLDVGVNEVASNIVLGGPKPTDIDLGPPLPPTVLPLPPLLDLPEGGPLAAAPTTSTTTFAPECPEADPLSAPKVQARTTIANPPVPGRYFYRNDGTFEVTGANAQKGRFPQTTVREVAPAKRASDGTFTYDVAASLAGTVTTTSYLVVPEPADNAGVYITSVTTKMGNDPPSSFNPEPDLKFLDFPMELGANWQTAGVDAATGRVVGFRGEIGNRTRIDACGELLDAFTLTLDGSLGSCPQPPPQVPPGTVDPKCLAAANQGGQQAQPGARERFFSTYAIGSQFGGLALSDTVEIFTDTPNASIYRKNTATISRVPPYVD